jgi:hypothetical protein
MYHAYSGVATIRNFLDAVFADWLWWEVVDTPLQGAAVVLTANDGVIMTSLKIPPSIPAPKR